MILRCLPVVFASLACAQKSPDPLDPHLIIQSHAVADLIASVETGAEAARLAPEQLADYVRSFVRPSLARGEDARSLGDVLLVCRGRPQQQVWIEQFLARLRRRPAAGIDIQSHFARVPTAVFKRDLAKQMTEVTAVASLQTLDQQQARLLTAGRAVGKPETLIDRLRRAEGVQFLESPRIRQLELQRASMSFLRNKSYVKDHHVETNKERTVLTPVVDVVREGVAFDSTAATLPDGSCGVVVRANVLDLLDMGDEEIERAGKKVKIQRPRIRHWRIEDSLALPEGEMAAYAIPMEREQEGYLVILIRVL